MITIAYPTQKPKLKEIGSITNIFCIVRKKWVVLTPEEWVRQNFLLYLTIVLQYPLPLIAVEKQVLFTTLKKRFDIVVYNNAIPYLIIECKEMNVPLAENTLLQVLHYNATIQAAILIITNGHFCKAYKKNNTALIELSTLPAFEG